jgi:hypothetical protein
METHDLRTRHRVACLLGATAALWALVAVGATGSQYGQAFAGVDILPGVGEWLPDTIGGIVEQAPSWGATVTDLAPEVGVVALGAGAEVVALPGEVVAGGVLAVGVALYASWKLGNALGGALPCLSCTGVVVPPSHHVYSNGISVDYQLKDNTGPGGVDQAVADVTLPAGLFVNNIVVQGFYAPANDTASQVVQGVGQSYSAPHVVSTTLNATAAGGCGPSCTGNFQSECVLVYTGSGTSGLVLRANYGGAPAAYCSTFVADASGSTSGQTQAPTSTSGGSAGTTPAPAKDLVIRSTAKCRSAAGVMSTVVLDSAVFHDNSPDAYPVIPIPSCEPGTRVKWDAKVHPLDGSFPDKTLISTADLSTQTAPSAHPEYAPCLPGGANYPCALTLQRVLSDGSLRPYDPAVDYETDPAMQPDKFPKAWLCKWGPLKVAVAECSPIYKQPPREVPPSTATEDSFCHFKLSRPWTWPYQAIKCAFVPPPGTFEGAFADVDFCDNAVGVLACAASDIVAPWTHLGEGASSDCEGGAVGVPVLDPRTVGTDPDLVLHPWSACSSAAQAVSGFWLPFASAAVYFGAFLLGAKALSRTIGADSPV